ncbi:hypothetical protein ACPB24_22575, partial [Escherichia coli]
MKYIATSVVAMLLLSGCDNTQSNNSSPSETEVGVVTVWICPYISRHLLSLNPLQARCRRYSR